MRGAYASGGPRGIGVIGATPLSGRGCWFKAQVRGAATARPNAWSRTTLGRDMHAQAKEIGVELFARGALELSTARNSSSASDSTLQSRVRARLAPPASSLEIVLLDSFPHRPPIDYPFHIVKPCLSAKRFPEYVPEHLLP